MTAPSPSRPSEVKEWCISGGFHPSRTLGQNFLTDGNAIDFIVDASGAAPGRNILEVGPGLGAITRPMLERGASVTAVEKDERLASLLRRELSAHSEHFDLIVADALDLPLDEFLGRRFDAFVSNLPYSVGTRILLDICRHQLAPPLLLVMVQREVADRLAASPGDDERGLAGVWVQARWDVKPLRAVTANCFWPRPEVSSTVVQLTLHDRLPAEAAKRFYRLTKVAFTQRRKQLATILKNNAAVLGLAAGSAAAQQPLAAAAVDPAARPESLSHEDWLRLALALPATP